MKHLTQPDTAVCDRCGRAMRANAPDRLRQIVLEGLGWELHRIWSTDWWRNPQGPMSKILDRLEALMAKAPGIDEPELDSVTEPVAVPDETSETVEPPARQVAYARMVNPSDDDSMASAAAPMVDPAAPPVYRTTSVVGGRSERFYEASSTPVLRDQLTHIIENEGPIADFVVFRRVARAWGLARTGNRIEERLRSLVPMTVPKTKDTGHTFYWPMGVDPGNWAGYRVADEAEDSRRQLDEIALEELGNLAVFVLSEHGSTSPSDLARTICRLYRISRTTADAEARVNKALTSGRARELVVVEDGRAKLK